MAKAKPKTTVKRPQELRQAAAAIPMWNPQWVREAPPPPPPKAPDALGPVIQKAREAAGLTQVELAEILDISRWTMSRLENGHCPWRPAWIEKLPPTMRLPIVRYLQRRQQTVINDLEKWAQPAPPRLIARPREPLGARAASRDL